MKKKNVLAALIVLMLLVLPCFSVASVPEWGDPAIELHQGIPLKANLYIDHYGQDGKLKDHREYHNMIVDDGFAGVASRINGSGAEAVFNYVAIGIGASGPAAGDHTLGSEITTGGGERAIAAVSRITTGVTNDTAKWVITYNFTLSFAVTESGILNAASTGTLLARRVFAAINVVNGDSLQVSWTVQCQ